VLEHSTSIATHQLIGLVEDEPAHTVDLDVLLDIECEVMGTARGGDD